MVHETRHPLLERRDALDALARVTERLQGGRGGSLFVCADAGLGKTSLLDVAQRLASPTVRVHRGRGSAMEVDVPFGLAVQVLEPLAPGMLVGGRETGADACDASATVLRDAKARIEAAVAQVPLLLIVDDMHWSDADSLGVLTFLVTATAKLPVVLLAAMRPWPAAALSEARRAEAQGGAELLTLSPLSRRGSDAMVTHLLGRPPSESACAAAWSFARGNPYLIEQVVPALEGHGELLDRCSEVGRPRDALLLTKLAYLGEPAVSCAQAAAVLGVEFRIALVPAVAGLPPESALGGLDSLFAGGVVRETRPGWAEFTHALVSEAIYNDILPGRRAALHRRAFERLADLGEVSMAARHAVAADLVGDATAVAVVEAAARASLAAGAVLAAVELLRSAISLAGGAAPSSLHILAGRALLAAGLPVEAAEHFQLALADRSLSSAAGVQVYRLLALALAYGGDLAASEQVSGTALELARREEPERVSGVLLDRLHAVWQAAGPKGALRLLDRMEQETALPVDPAFKAARLFITYCGTGDAAILRELAVLAAAAGEGPVSPFAPVLVYACVARWEERFDEDDRVLDLGEAAAQEAGVLRALFALRLARADNRILQGRPKEALASLAALERDLPIEPLMGPAVAAAQAITLCQLGRLDEAAARLDLTDTATLTWQVRLAFSAARARLLFGRGDVSEACESYREVESLAGHLGVNAPLVRPWAAGAMAAYQAAGQLDDCERVCEWLEARSCGSGTWPRMIALAGRAGLARHRGDHELAEELYGEAVSLPSRLALDRAGVLVSYAEFLRSTRRQLRSRPVFAEALSIAEEAGASQLAARAVAGLRAAGGRRARRVRNPSELSERERLVAALAADGLTTAEIARQLFVSPKTVETHLGRVYAKLGVTSRRALRNCSFSRPDADGAGSTGHADATTRRKP